MSEMVERVARAIWALNEDTDCSDYDQLAPHAKERAAGWARAAIEAMREPTEGMEKAGASKWDEDLCTETNALNMWQAMIDEALK